MKKKIEVIELTKPQKDVAISKIKNYLENNFEADIGNLQSEIFLDYITEHIGVFYYNNAVADSLSFMTEKAEDLYLLMKDEDLEK